MRVADALTAATEILNKAGVAGATRDARRILTGVCEFEPHQITLRSDDELSETEETAFLEAIHLRAAGHPVSHLVGGRLFYDRWFQVTPDVLDPRPETEELVVEALRAPYSDILDLGTGSGAIVLTLLAERPMAAGVATDLSAAALRVAEGNARAFGVQDRVRFALSDWFSNVSGQFDLIVSNPPYIAADEMEALQPEVRLYEPRMALTDEADGLTAYTKITAGAPAHLRPGGRLLVEIGPTQAAAVSAMMEKAGFDDIRVIPDLDGRDRVVAARKP